MTPVEIPLAVYGLFAAPLTALALGFFVFRPWKPEWTHAPILASCAVVAACAAHLGGKVLGGWGIDAPLYTWMWVNEWGVTFGARIDGLSASVLCMVALVGGLIHLYAAAYMRGDSGFPRFFLLFHLFFLAMVGLLVSNNYVQLYLFWELVGAASYLLIGYWHHKSSARRAALQAFLTNRVGDFGLMLAVLVILFAFRGGMGRFAVIFPLIHAADAPLLALAGLLLFWAACAKSAQFPLHFWLPDAMEGPTPVSALMHAATMVTAGIFLLARSWPLIAVVGNLPEIIAWTGAVTATGAAAVAATKTDLKRILAYSTVSHLGIMAFALGLGQISAAIFHLITHGFFKAVLFLCAGNIAHALAKPTATVDEVGGLAGKMPLTFLCFCVAALSLAGVWPFAGFYSKDAVLDAAFHHGGAFMAVGLLIAFGSAFYIFRMLCLVFLGPRPDQAPPAHPHEAGPMMAVPVAFLSIGALGVGWLAPGLLKMLASGWMPRGSVPSLPAPSLPVALAGTAAAGLGALLAWWLTTGLPRWDWQWRKSRPGLERAFESDFGWKTVVARLARLVGDFADRFGRGFDLGVVDALVEGGAGRARAAAGALAVLATGLLNDYLWWMLAATTLLLWTALR